MAVVIVVARQGSEEYVKDFIGMHAERSWVERVSGQIFHARVPSASGAHRLCKDVKELGPGVVQAADVDIEEKDDQMADGVHHLPGLCAGVLQELAARNELDVAVRSLGNGTFVIKGGLNDRHMLLGEVQYLVPRSPT